MSTIFLQQLQIVVMIKLHFVHKPNSLISQPHNRHNLLFIFKKNGIVYFLDSTDKIGMASHSYIEYSKMPEHI